MSKLTKRRVDALKPQEREFFAWDAELKGFGLRVMPSGRKVYEVQYRAGRRSRRFKLGDANVLTPDEARRDAKQLLAGVSRGDDPAGVRIHDLRHTYASVAVQSGIDPFLLKEIMGHKNLTTTLRYAHLADETVQRAASQVAARFASSLGAPGERPPLRVVR